MFCKVIWWLIDLIGVLCKLTFSITTECGCETCKNTVKSAPLRMLRRKTPQFSQISLLYYLSLTSLIWVKERSGKVCMTLLQKYSLFKKKNIVVSLLSSQPYIVRLLIS